MSSELNRPKPEIAIFGFEICNRFLRFRTYRLDRHGSHEWKTPDKRYSNLDPRN